MANGDPLTGAKIAIFDHGFGIDHCWTVACRQHFDGGLSVIAGENDAAPRISESCLFMTVINKIHMTESLDVTPKTTEQNLIVVFVRTGKSEAEVPVISNNRLRLRYCNVEADY